MYVKKKLTYIMSEQLQESLELKLSLFYKCEAHLPSRCAGFHMASPSPAVLSGPAPAQHRPVRLPPAFEAARAAAALILVH